MNGGRGSLDFLSELKLSILKSFGNSDIAFLTSSSVFNFIGLSLYETKSAFIFCSEK